MEWREGKLLPNDPEQLNYSHPRLGTAFSITDFYFCFMISLTNTFFALPSYRYQADVRTRVTMAIGNRLDSVLLRDVS